MTQNMKVELFKNLKLENANLFPMESSLESKIEFAQIYLEASGNVYRSLWWRYVEAG